jgi:hypothetical protein
MTLHYQVQTKEGLFGIDDWLKRDRFVCCWSDYFYISCAYLF